MIPFSAEPLLAPNTSRHPGRKDSEPTELIGALLITDIEGARLAGISRSTWHRLRAAGKLGPLPIRLGRSLRWRQSEVSAWIDAGCPDARTWTAMTAQKRRLRVS